MTLGTLTAVLMVLVTTVASAAPYLGTKIYRNPTFTSGRVASPTAWPNVTWGKLYFRTTATSGFSTCTAGVVNDGSKDKIITAGHCVNSGGASDAKHSVPGIWYRDFRFYPGATIDPSGGTYSGPGDWPWAKVATTNSWYYYKNWHDDFAVLTLNRDSRGRHVQDVVGALGWIFNVRNDDSSRNFYAVGYPVNLDNATRQRFCRAPVYGLFNYGPSRSDGTDGSQYGIGCDMTQGASGGPWVTSNNIAHTVSSFIIPGKTYNNVLFGSYLGQQSYDAFRAATPAAARASIEQNGGPSMTTDSEPGTGGPPAVLSNTAGPAASLSKADFDGAQPLPMPIVPEDAQPDGPSGPTGPEVQLPAAPPANAPVPGPLLP